MTAPTFVGAGTGITITSTSGVVSKTGCVAGNIILIQAVVNGVGQNVSYDTITNITSIQGVPNSLDTSDQGGNLQAGSPATGRHALFWGRATANGTCSANANITSNDLVVRIYEFAGVNPGTATNLADITDNILGSGGPYTQSSATSATCSCASPALTTIGSDRLALALVGITGNVTTTDFTGETGGDWTEALAEYADTPGTLQLQTSALASAGTISGGSQTIISNGYSVLTFALEPASAAAPSDDPPMHRLGMSAGW